jgi:trehalose 6-phosphate phosphatase
MSTALVQAECNPIQADCSLFFEDLNRAADRVLLLDYDGTMAPFAADRKRAFPYPSVPELVDSIMSTCRTRVALISGRAAHEIPPLLGLNPHPEIWGAHGLERLYPDGRYELTHVSPETMCALAEADEWLEQEGLHDCTELKPGGLAVHWRGLGPSQAQEVKTRAYRALSLIAHDGGLLLAEFDGGLEMRVPTRNKGDAVRTILCEAGSSAIVAYLGDDLSDDSAFQAMHRKGLSVLVRAEYRPCAAQMWLRPPDELVQFLTDWLRACGGDM